MRRGVQQGEIPTRRVGEEIEPIDPEMLAQCVDVPRYRVARSGPPGTTTSGLPLPTTRQVSSVPSYVVNVGIRSG